MGWGGLAFGDRSMLKEGQREGEEGRGTDGGTDREGERREEDGRLAKPF